MMEAAIFVSVLVAALIVVHSTHTGALVDDIMQHGGRFRRWMPAIPRRWAFQDLAGLVGAMARRLVGAVVLTSGRLLYPSIKAVCAAAAIARTLWCEWQRVCNLAPPPLRLPVGSLCTPEPYSHRL